MILNSWIDVGLFALSCWLYMGVRRRKAVKRTAASQTLKFENTRKIDAHSFLAAFVSEIDARNFVSQQKCSPYCRDLGADWIFKLYENYEAAVGGLSSSSQGTTSLDFSNRLSATGDTNIQPVGYCSCRFYVPAEWVHREVRILFPPTSDSFQIWINGHFSGFSDIYSTSSEFMIDDFLKFGGVNKLEVLVIPVSVSSTERSDILSFDALTDYIALLSLPRPVRISDFSWEIDYAEHLSGQGNASITVPVQLTWDMSEYNADTSDTEGVYPRSNFQRTSPDWFLCTQVFDEGVLISSTRDPKELLNRFVFDKPSSRAVSKQQGFVSPPRDHLSSLWTGASHHDERTNDCDDVVFHPSNIVYVSHVHRIKCPKFWSPDRPHTYTLVISLHSCADGGTVQSESSRISFRVVDVKDGLLRLNSRPVMIRGVNCHMKLNEVDIVLMKRNNINAVRVQSRDYDPLLYEFCTLYGLYVVDEISIPVNFLSDDEHENEVDMECSCLHSLSEKYEVSKNHPCVIIWALGSAALYDKIHDKMAQWLRKRDSTRLVFFERASYGPRKGAQSTTPTPRSMATDILCPANAEICDCIVLANRYPDMPLVLSTYGGDTGNISKSLSVYWNSFNAYARLQGGFLCDWQDQLLAVRTAAASTTTSGKTSMEQIPSTIARIHGVVCAESLSSNWSSAMVAFDEENYVLAKPQLLEVKQCMKMFDSALADIVFTTEVLDDGCPNDCSIDLTVNAGILISNFMDHNDMDKSLDFDVLLLIDGIVVSASHFMQQESSMVHRHRVWDEADGRIDFQEVKGFCLFTLTLTASRDDPGSYLVRGVVLPENMFIAPCDIDSLDPGAHFSNSTNVVLSLAEPDESRWDIVVISQSIANTSWCNKGFPLGFKQLSISPERVCMWKDVVRRVIGNNTVASKDKLTLSKSNYAVTVTWQPDISYDVPNIVIRAETAGGDHTGSGRPGVVEALISGATGLIVSLQADGKQILSDGEHLGDFDPMQLCFHADRQSADYSGYTEALQAIGFGQTLQYTTTCHEYDPFRSQDGSITEPVQLRSIRVERIGAAIDVDSTGSCTCPGEGVACEWELVPTDVDRGKTLLLFQLQQFVGDATSRSVILELFSDEQEYFVYKLAGLFRLGSEVIPVDEGVDNSDAARNVGSVDSCKVRLWKLSAYPSSVIPHMENPYPTPTGVLRYDRKNALGGLHLLSRSCYDNEHQASFADEENGDDNDMRILLAIKCKMTYTLDRSANLIIRGDIDLSGLPMLPRGVGFQLNFPKDEFHYCSWEGMGPHHNDTDSKSSTVNACHQSDINALSPLAFQPYDVARRSDVKRLTLSSSQLYGSCPDLTWEAVGCGSMRLDVRGSEPFGFSMQQYVLNEACLKSSVTTQDYLCMSILRVSVEVQSRGSFSGDGGYSYVGVSDESLGNPQDLSFQFTLSTANTT